jgi:hypothetical protein
MSILTDTERFEKWLRTQCDVVEDDLTYKHERMRKNAFVFLRATYYRWARKVRDWCPEVLDAPEVLAIGDLHTENFGTWHDGDGRLVWGVNDFDEAARMPYTLDLVRLAASAILAPEQPLTARRICDAIQSGYEHGLENQRPTILDEYAVWMRAFVIVTDADCEKFWDEVEKYPNPKRGKPPKRVTVGLQRSLPKGAEIKRFCTCRKGGGSLGRPRYVAVAKWHGGQVVREAKALVPSAWDWAHKPKPDGSAFFEVAWGRHRSPDPFLSGDRHFVYRRIAPNDRKADLGDDAGRKLPRELLRAMGRDLAATHAAHPKRRDEVAADLKKRPSGWLTRAAQAAAKGVQRDFETWRAQPAAAETKRARKGR